MVPVLLVYALLLALIFFVGLCVWLMHKNQELKRRLTFHNSKWAHDCWLWLRRNEILRFRCERLAAGLRNKIEIERLRTGMYEKTIQAMRRCSGIAHAGQVGDKFEGVYMVPMRALRDIQLTLSSLQTDLATLSPEIINLLKKQKKGKELPVDEQVPAKAVATPGPEGLGESEGDTRRPSGCPAVAPGAGNERQPV